MKGHRQRQAVWRRYNLTEPEYARLHLEQGGGCAICRAPHAYHGLCVDHDHASGRVRGLLCGNCNKALGLLGDDPARCRSAAEYLLAR